jgi:ligand-binding SRPBCC domain-containing protein
MKAQYEQWIGVPLPRVFLFFADPRNLSRVMPEWMDLRLERIEIVPSPPEQLPTSMAGETTGKIAGLGSRLHASYRALPGLPWRVRSVARITAFEMNRYFEDSQVKGPFKSWHHRHEFVREDRNGIEGTLIRDVIEYELSPRWLQGVVSRLFLGPQLSRTFAYRRQKIGRLLR